MSVVGAVAHYVSILTDLARRDGVEKQLEIVRTGFLPDERAWMDRVLALGIRDVFREVNPELVAYSWWSNRGRAREKDVGWRIDSLLATPGLRVSRAVIERDAGLSDHAPVSAWIELPSTTSAAAPR